LITNFKNYIRQTVPISDMEFEESSVYFIEKTLKKHEYFVQQGNISKQVAFINKGILRSYYLNEESQEITSCFCVEENLTTSFTSFVLQKPSEISIQAMEETELLIINYEDLQKLYSISLAWQNIGRAFAEKEYIIIEQYASSLNSESAKVKYLRLLKEQPQIIQKAPIQYIASYLGITTRTLSRIRKEIKK
jgi:CRP-like cAMP-binding protein